MAWPRNEALEHLRALAKQHKLKIVWVTPWHHASATDGGKLYIPKPWNARLYLVALHEFGHQVDKVARRHWDDDGDSAKHLACEGAATGWAIMHIPAHLVPHVKPSDLDHLMAGFREHAEDEVRHRRRFLIR